ncbi:hypothetical protein DUI87_26091 [Hirundo rustica rustica]|uniref:RNase H type-1 domain-containing protein n=1 Tax=Hirundo rustica rustica TaxID=333673 RepID=A0A3M0JEG4_HIRRU|nr:hypothetical protein DUI87_26091 [Hirundo rustica rustica]
MSHPALRFLDQQEWQPWPNVQSQPLPEEQTVFTDAGRKTRLAVCVWQKDSSWHHHKIQGMAEDSLQTLELRVVIWALGQSRDEDLNIVSDSLYVVGVVQRIEEALLPCAKEKAGIVEGFLEIETERPCSVGKMLFALALQGEESGNEPLAPEQSCKQKNPEGHEDHLNHDKTGDIFLHPTTIPPRDSSEWPWSEAIIRHTNVLGSYPKIAIRTEQL